MSEPTSPPPGPPDAGMDGRVAFKSISFCISCRNRLRQLSQTLPGNLDCLDEDVEISLVDYGSSDGLSDWVRSRFGHFIETGRLVFFEVLNPVS